MQRARKLEDKQARRTAIVEAAHALLEERGDLELKVSDVADRLGLSKGTLFLYFPTKESLLLAVLEERLAQWFDLLEEKLVSCKQLDARKAAQLVARSLAGQEVLARLLGVLHGVLEANVDAARVLQFKQFLLGRMMRLAGPLHAKLPFLPRHAGAQLLLTINALVIGLRQMADPGPAVRGVLAREEMAPLRVEFEPAFSAALEALLRGLEHG